MLYKQIFIDEISNAINSIDYFIANDVFYIYKRELGLIIKLSFDVQMGGSDFFIYGGLSSFSDRIELWPNSQLSIYGYDVSTYATRCGQQAFSNMNPILRNGLPKRYTKKEITNRICYNIDMLKKYLLKDIMQISNLKEYYDFKVKADGFGYYLPLPFPSIDTFFLCISLDRFKQASHIYNLMLRRNDDNINTINKYMELPFKSYIEDSLLNSETRFHSKSSLNSLSILESEAYIIENILIKQRSNLLITLDNTITNSRTVCDTFFRTK